jgi:hypothetical protein
MAGKRSDQRREQMNLIALLDQALCQLSAKSKTSIQYCLTVENGDWWIWRDGSKVEGHSLAGIREIAVTNIKVIVYMTQPKRALEIMPNKWVVYVK